MSNIQFKNRCCWKYHYTSKCRARSIARYLESGEELSSRKPKERGMGPIRWRSVRREGNELAVRVIAGLVKTCRQGLDDEQTVQKKNGDENKNSNKGSRGWQAPKQVRACASTVTTTGRRGVRRSKKGLLGWQVPRQGSDQVRLPRQGTDQNEKKNGDPARVHKAGSKQQVGARAFAVTRNGQRRSQCGSWEESGGESRLVHVGARTAKKITRNGQQGACDKGGSPNRWKFIHKGRPSTISATVWGSLARGTDLSTAPYYIKLTLSLSRAHGDTKSVVSQSERQEKDYVQDRGMRLWAMHDVTYFEEAVHTTNWLRFFPSIFFSLAKSNFEDDISQKVFPCPER